MHRRLLLRRYPGLRGAGRGRRRDGFGGAAVLLRRHLLRRKAGGREFPADGLSGKGERRDGGGAVPAHGGAGAAPTGGVRDDERRILRREGAPLY